MSNKLEEACEVFEVEGSVTWDLQNDRRSKKIRDKVISGIIVGQPFHVPHPPIAKIGTVLGSYSSSEESGVEVEEESDEMLRSLR